MPSFCAACAWTRLAGWVVISGLIALSLGCASTHVQTVSLYHGSEPLPKPERLLIYDFAISPDDVSLNSGPMARLRAWRAPTTVTDEQQELGRAVAHALSEELVKRLQALGLPAERASGDQPLAVGILAIQGQFVSIDEGNRLRRTLIGFGLGGTEVRTLAQVYRGTAQGPSLLQAFETVAESAKKPGMATPMGVGAAVGRGLAAGAAIGAGVGAATEHRQTVEADARRTADTLVEQLIPFFTAQGWLTPQGGK